MLEKTQKNTSFWGTTCTREDNIKMDPTEVERMRTGLNWLRIGSKSRDSSIGTRARRSGF